MWQKKKNPFISVQVVLSKSISKTQKVRFFTPAVLANIASLYKWNGIVDATIDNTVSHLLIMFLVFLHHTDTSNMSAFFCNLKMKEDSEHNGISTVRELVHTFLLDLCCSRKHGISFHDASFGTAGR